MLARMSFNRSTAAGRRSHRSFLLAGLVLASQTACGAPQTPDKAPEAEGGSQTPDQECLDAANAEHSPKPDAPLRIGLRHILVRHKDAKNAGVNDQRSRGEACLRALSALEELQSGAEWDAVVAKFSDEKGAAARHGSLGSLTQDDLDPSFAGAAFELDVDQLSYVVESPSGFHVILRTE